MKTCCFYRVVGQLVGNHSDDGSKDIATRKIAFRGGQEGDVSLVGTARRIELVRLRFSVEDEVIPDEIGEQIGQLYENVLCGIRLSVDPEAAYGHLPGQPFFSVWNFIDLGDTPKFDLKVGYGGPHARDMQNALSLAGVQGDELIAMRLLADGQSLRLPIQYRFLSLFKILELYYRQPTGAWDASFNDLLQEHAESFESLKTGRASFKKVLFECRDKCAHIRTGHLRAVGAFGADAAPSLLIVSVLPLLLNIVGQVINNAAEKNGSGLKIVSHGEKRAEG